MICSDTDCGEAFQRFQTLGLWCSSPKVEFLQFRQSPQRSKAIAGKFGRVDGEMMEVDKGFPVGGNRIGYQRWFYRNIFYLSNMFELLEPFFRNLPTGNVKASQSRQFLQFCQYLIINLGIVEREMLEVFQFAERSNPLFGERVRVEDSRAYGFLGVIIALQELKPQLPQLFDRLSLVYLGLGLGFFFLGWLLSLCDVYA
jgi:hypothetical protein